MSQSKETLLTISTNQWVRTKQTIRIFIDGTIGNPMALDKLPTRFRFRILFYLYFDRLGIIAHLIVRVAFAFDLKLM